MAIGYYLIILWGGSNTEYDTPTYQCISLSLPLSLSLFPSPPLSLSLSLSQSQLHDLKQSQSTESSQLHKMMVDPAVNVMFSCMKKQLADYKEKLSQAQNDLSAWKFTPDR